MPIDVQRSDHHAPDQLPKQSAAASNAVAMPPSAAPLPFAQHPRRGDFPAQLPKTRHGRPLRVALVYAVCYRFRMPIFRRLSAHPGLDVRVFAGTGLPGTKFSNAPDLSGIDVRILWSVKKRVRSTGRDACFTVCPTLAAHLLAFRPDVLLVQGGMLPDNLLTLAYAKLTRTPIVWWSLGEVRGRQFRGLSAVYRRLTQWVERQAAAYAGYSSAAVDYFLGQGYDERKCFNLINVVDTDLVERQREQCRPMVSPLRQRLGLDGKRVILFVGSIIATKGLDILLQALARIHRQHPQAHLLVVGEGPERAANERLAGELGIADRVTFTGAVYENVSAYFQLADLMVMPGTGGLAISEAMVHGLPVLCAVGDGVEVDLIEVAKNGYHLPPGDVVYLAERLDGLLSDTDRLREMGEHSRAIIRDKANIDRYLSEMLSALAYAYKSTEKP